MLRTDSISLHVPEPLALIDAALLFTVQVLLVVRRPLSCRRALSQGRASGEHARGASC
jgi:hypothetical protein